MLKNNFIVVIKRSNYRVQCCVTCILIYCIPYVMIAVDIPLTALQFYCVPEEKGHAVMKERVAHSHACHQP